MLLGQHHHQNPLPRQQKNPSPIKKRMRSDGLDSGKSQMGNDVSKARRRD